jgi:hypothetical protein
MLLIGMLAAPQAALAQAPISNTAAAVPRAAAAVPVPVPVPEAAAADSRERLYFSTEEDFLTRGPVPPDGNPLISDGDLLVLPNYPGLDNVAVYARNRELLQRFEVREDLGLDAVDVIEPKQRLVAFSTELDDPGGRFTAGDLLVTSGAVLPNATLLAAFDLPQSLDLGLDAVQFTGKPEAILKVLSLIQERGRAAWAADPGALRKLLEETDVDILFSTEGTAPSPEKPRFLDGDLLSARTGAIVIANADFLPSLPAGLPERGVDFGCDAFAIAWDPIEQMWLELFSTEIDSLARHRPFTDGDMLARGGAVAAKNGMLIHGLEPVVDEVGLDALDYTGHRDGPSAMEITHIWRVATTQLSPEGKAPNNLLGDATPPTVKDRPFGGWLEIHGNLPPATAGFDPADYDYRLEYKRPAGTWAEILTPDYAHPTDVNWIWELPAASPPGSTIVYRSDSEGWIDLGDFWKTDDKTALGAWRSQELGDGPTALRIALRQKGGAGAVVYSPEVPVYLDNHAPHDGTSQPDIRFSSAIADPCAIPPSDRTLTIEGEVRDEHFYYFALDWYANVPGWANIAVSYHDQGLSHLDGSGTLPPGSYPVVGTVTIPTGIECGYVRMRAQDRTIVGEFHPSPPGLADDLDIEHDAWESYDWVTFCFKGEAAMP